MCDSKLLLGIFPHYALDSQKLREDCEAEVLRFAAWSMGWGERGIGPSHGFYGEPVFASVLHEASADVSFMIGLSFLTQLTSTCAYIYVYIVYVDEHIHP